MGQRPAARCRDEPAGDGRQPSNGANRNGARTVKVRVLVSQHAGQIVLVERSFCGQDADRHGGPARGEGRGRGPVGCGSSLTRCGRQTGPRLPCPPHGEHAPIGVRQYRARPFFASASPAPLPRSLFDQHEPSVLAHPPTGEIRLVDLEPEQRQALSSAHSIR
jgi:hypothetical protein